MNKKELNLVNFNDSECKVIKRLLLDFECYERDLKYFNAVELINAFIHSVFYSSSLEYVRLKQRCMEYMIEEYSNC